MKIPLLFILFFLVSCGDLRQIFDSDVPTSPVVLFDGDVDKARPNSYIVTFKSSGRKTFRDFTNQRSQYLHFYSSLTERYHYRKGIKNLDFMTAVDLSIDVESEASWLEIFNPPLALLSAIGMTKSEDSTVGLITEVEFETPEDAKAILNMWAKRGDIWYAEPNYLSQPFFSEYEKVLESTSSKYWLERINWQQAISFLASKTRTVPNKPIIAVMDSGVEYKHPYLATRMFQNSRVGLSDCKDDLYGCNTTAGQKDILGNGAVEPFNQQEGGDCPDDANGNCSKDCCHGTHVAGIIAALDPAQTQQQMIGVCPMCQIIAIRVVEGKGGKSGIPDSAIIRGLIYVTRFESADAGQAIRIVNASFGKFQASRAVGAMVRALKKTGNGILVVGAAGNEDTMRRAYPAAFPDAIAVSNIAESGPKARSSNFGPWVDVAANGDYIDSTVPGSKQFEQKTGTSMSAPVVAGLAGLLLAAEPGLSANALRDRIINTSSAAKLYDDEINSGGYYPTIAGAGVRVPLLGAGFIDANAAVQNDTSGTIASADAVTRVDEGCGHVGRLNGTQSLLLMLVFLLLPSVVGLAQHKF